MGFFKPRRSTAPTEPDRAPEPAAPQREFGPWDITEQPELGRRLDFGALRFGVPRGYAVQRPANDNDGTVPVVMLRGPEGVLRLRVFAAPKDSGMWDEMRSDVLREVDERGGKAAEVDGPFGPEAHCVLPVEGPKGEKMVQPSRVIGVDGPRWTVRGTFLGPVAKEPKNDGDLMSVFRDLVVARGAEARRAGEPLPLTIPRGAEDVETPGASETADG